MPPYATVADLLKRQSAQNLAEAASRDNILVDGDLLTRAVAADNIDTALADESDEARTAVKAAIAAIEADIQDAGDLIDGYIGASAGIEADTKRAYTIDIALWRILGGTEESARYLAYKQVVDWLIRIAKGETAAPAGPDNPAAAAAGARFQGDAPLFTRASLGREDADEYP